MARPKKESTQEAKEITTVKEEFMPIMVKDTKEIKNVRKSEYDYLNHIAL